jgi:hypothetical protein
MCSCVGAFSSPLSRCHALCIAASVHSVADYNLLERLCDLLCALFGRRAANTCTGHVWAAGLAQSSHGLASRPAAKYCDSALYYVRWLLACGLPLDPCWLHSTQGLLQAYSSLSCGHWPHGAQLTLSRTCWLASSTTWDRLGQWIGRATPCCSGSCRH